jgi:hypothetical protein
MKTFLYAIDKLPGDFASLVRTAMDSWSKVAAVEFLLAAATDTPAIRLTTASGRAVGMPDGTGAITAGGVITFNSDFPWTPDYFLREAAHELGHAQGLLVHSPRPGAVMNISSSVAAPSWDDDIPRIHAIYGPAAGFPTAIPAGAVPPGVDNALPISVDLPINVLPGTSCRVSITLRNIGSTTWTPGHIAPGDLYMNDGGYGLGAFVRLPTFDNDHTWGSERLLLPTDVLPGEQIVISGTVTAPSIAANTPFLRQMVRERRSWFGYAVDTAINVTGVAPPIAKPPDFSRIRLTDDSGKLWRVTGVELVP